MAGLAPLARAKLVACRLLHRSPPRRSSSSPLRAGRCAALHLHRDRAPRRLPHAGARRGLNICAGPVAVSPRVRDGPRDNANAPRLPMSPDPTTGVVSPAPCSGQERSSTSGAGRHLCRAVARPDHQTPEKGGGIGVLRLDESSPRFSTSSNSRPLPQPDVGCRDLAMVRVRWTTTTSRRRGNWDDSEQFCSDPVDSVHEGSSPNNRAFTKPSTSGRVRRPACRASPSIPARAQARGTRVPKRARISSSAAGPPLYHQSRRSEARSGLSRLPAS